MQTVTFTLFFIYLVLSVILPKKNFLLQIGMDTDSMPGVGVGYTFVTLSLLANSAREGFFFFLQNPMITAGDVLITAGHT